MISDIDVGRRSSALYFLIAPSMSARWQSGRSGDGDAVAGPRSVAVRRCRYPIPASEARHGTVDAVPGRGAASADSWPWWSSAL